MEENKNGMNKTDNANNDSKGRQYVTENNSEDERARDREQGRLDGPGHGFCGRRPGHPGREDMSLEDVLLHQLRSCTHFFRYGMGGKTGQQRILAVLAERGIITQRELQDMLGVQSGSLSEILNKVEACGYIMRRQNEKDRRQMNLELTETGREAARNFREEHMEKARTMFDGLTEDEKKQLSSLLEKMMEHWPRMEDRGACGRRFHGRSGRRGFPGPDGECGTGARRRGGRMGGRNSL